MLEPPPAQLVDLLERLQLASASDVARMTRRVRRLARDLPHFESVWVDALAQARLLTRFQAIEINAGRGHLLRIGPYVLEERLAEPYYAACYRARNLETQTHVRLALVDPAHEDAGRLLPELEQLASRALRAAADEDDSGQGVASSRQTASVCNLITHVGIDHNRIFAAAPWVAGRSAAIWLAHHGRLPSAAVLEIARAMVAQLCQLEHRGICHGDVSAASLLLGENGGAILALPGLRGILRPEEGFAHADLLPEAYDGLAPERITAGTQPNMASDIYACGCLWWQLLCGRAPLAGGNSLTKLRAAQTADIGDVRRFASDVPANLASVIAECVQSSPTRRPHSPTQLAALLGPSTRDGREAVADCLARAGRPAVRWTTTVRAVRKSRRTPLWVAGVVCALTTLVAVAWPLMPNPAQTNPLGPPPTIASASAHDRQPAPSSAVLTAIQPMRAVPSAAAAGAQPVNRPQPVVEDALAAGAQTVVAASYQQPAVPPGDLVITADQPVAVGALRLQPGQRVRGPAGQRAVLVVPHDGLAVDQDGVCFENIDFVWRDAQIAAGNNTPAPHKAAPAALLRVMAGHVAFHGCSFAVQTNAARRPAAITWRYPAQASAAALSLPSGRVQLADCTFAAVAAGIDAHAWGALVVEVTNTLYMGRGPLLRLDHWPGADEAVAVSLVQTTLRESGPLLECRARRNPGPPGEIALQSAACVFAPAQNVPLLLFGNGQPTARLRWTGQGSLVTPDTILAAFVDPDGQGQVIDENTLAIAGLVRSAVGFAGKIARDPTASRAIQWQAPLQTADPPGIDPAALSSPL